MGCKLVGSTRLLLSSCLAGNLASGMMDKTTTLARNYIWAHVQQVWGTCGGILSTLTELVGVCDPDGTSGLYMWCGAHIVIICVHGAAKLSCPVSNWLRSKSKLLFL